MNDKDSAEMNRLLAIIAKQLERIANRLDAVGIDPNAPLKAPSYVNRHGADICAPYDPPPFWPHR